MGLLKQLNALIWTWSETLMALRRGAALAPFVIYAAVQCALLLAVVGFAYPPLSYIVAPALRWRFGDIALHYPGNLFVLRPALAQADSVLIVVLGAVLTATAIHAFGSHFSGRKSRFAEGWSAAGRRYFPLALVALVVMVATHFLARAPFSLLGALAENAPSKFRLVRLAAIALAIAVQTLFVYTPQGLVLSGKSLAQAVSGSFRLAFRTPLTSVLVVGVPAAFELLPLWLSRQSGSLAMKLTPEVLIWVMVLWIAIILIAGYITAGAATRFYLFSIQDDEMPVDGRDPR